MSRVSDLEARFSVAWKTRKPTLAGLGITSRSSNFSALGSEWYLEMSYFPVTTFYQIFLFKVAKECLKKPFCVTTFIETQENTGLPLLSNVTAVESTEQMLWSHGSIQISESFPQFHNGDQFKIVCMFHEELPSTRENMNGTANASAMIVFDHSLSARHNSSNRSKRKLTSDKSVQVCLEFSPDLERLSLDFCKMLEDKDIPDVQLRCRNHTFSAHRVVLSARSQVFAAMFRNKMAESESGIVDITDLDSSVLELILKYLYSGKIPSVSDDAVLDLYAAGDKYALHALKKACSERMVGSQTEENCLDFLTLADAHSDQDFKNAVVNFIVDHMWVLKSQAWSAFKEEYPKLAISLYEIIVNQKCFSV